MSGPGSPLAWGSSHSGIGPTHPVALLRGAAGWWDVAQYSASTPQVLRNLGSGGAALDAQFGSTTGVDTNDPQVLPFTGAAYVALPGVNGNYLSVPDAANLTPTASLSIKASMTLGNWAAANTIAAQWDSGVSNSRSWIFESGAGGGNRLGAYTSSSPTATLAAIIATADTPGAVAGATLNVEMRWEPNAVSFWTQPGGAPSTLASADGWEQVGATITAGGVVASLANSTVPFSIGARNLGSSTPSTGGVRRSILTIDGTTVLDVDTSVLTSGSAASFAALTGQTVTINRSATGRKAVAVVRPLILFGTDDYLTVPDSDLLDFADADSFTVLAVARQHGTQGGYSRLVSKINNGAGWALYNQISTAEVRGYVSDGTLSRFISAGATYPGSALGVSAMVRDRPNALLRLYGNGVQASATTDAGGQLATIANGLAMNIGRTPGGAEYADMEFLAAAVFRRALSATEIAQITAYYQQRMP